MAPLLCPLGAAGWRAVGRGRGARPRRDKWPQVSVGRGEPAPGEPAPSEPAPSEPAPSSARAPHRPTGPAINQLERICGARRAPIMMTGRQRGRQLDGHHDWRPATRWALMSSAETHTRAAHLRAVCVCRGRAVGQWRQDTHAARRLRDARRACQIRRPARGLARAPPRAYSLRAAEEFH